MVKIHRVVRDRLGADPSGVILDTPYGFQMNADDLSAKTVAYFRESVGMAMAPAGMRTTADLEGPQGAVAASEMAAADLLFSGPGSPTYALRQWKGTLVPGLLAEKLALGGAVTFASAAALTLGALSIPVYEVYKVGEDPHWVAGMDLLSDLGIRAIVVPHYDNAEGGTHDTRYCYLGEKRLALLEPEIPEGSFVLGVDEHTAIVFDLEASEATVLGRGHVTVRVRGRSAYIEADRTVELNHLSEIAGRLASGEGAASSVVDAGVAGISGGGALSDGRGADTESSPSAFWSNSPTSSTDGALVAAPEGTPLLQAIRALESRFRSAKESADTAGMVSAALELHDELWAWVADPNQSDELDRGKAALRAMIVELGALAAEAERDPTQLFGPFVDLLVENRNVARRERRFAEADAVRDGLASLGIEVHDTPEGSTWESSK